MVAAVFSAIISTGTLRFALGTVGISDASQTRSPSTPITRAWASVTANDNQEVGRVRQERHSWMHPSVLAV
jgi:hypothetical protein